MAIPFEKIVVEDLQRGYGTLSVTMPGGGTATGTKIGLTEFLGMVSVKDYGAVGDGVSDDSAAIQAALTTGHAVFFPNGTYYIGRTSLVPVTGQTLIGEDYTLTIISYAGTGSAFTFTKAVNGSGYGRITWRDLQITCTAAVNTNTGAGIELNAGGYAYFHVDHCRITGNFKYGVIGDGIEVSTFTRNIFDNGLGVTNSAHLWIVNGDERRSGQLLGFSNVITIADNQFNGADYGLIDDGGDVLYVEGNNFNGHSVGILMAGRTNFRISTNDFENHDRITGTANLKFSDRSGVGGGTATVDKGPCRGGFLCSNSLNMDMLNTGTACVGVFTATTAGAYHVGIMATGNILGNQLGRAAAWDVTRLGRSFIGYNTDEAASPHFTGAHNDTWANTLLTPGGTSDSVVGAFATLNAQLTATATWNPASMNDGATTSTTIAVTGAVVGDIVTASHDAIGANDVLVSAHVSSAGVVRVVLMNKSGAPLDIASGVLRVFVTKPTV